MDYEKLIEQLKQKDGLWCSVPTGEKLVTDAADALTALLAENEKLRDEAEGMRSNWYKAVEAVKSLRAEQEKAKTEITRLKHYEDKCAKTEIIKAHEELEAVQAELEQKSKLIAQQVAELERRDKLLKEQETELDQMKRERDAAIDCIYKIEDALDRGNDNDWAREHISEWESQKED